METSTVKAGVCAHDILHGDVLHHERGFFEMGDPLILSHNGMPTDANAALAPIFCGYQLSAPFHCLLAYPENYHQLQRGQVVTNPERV